jgi:hypothetical protein
MALNATDTTLVPGIIDDGNARSETGQSIKQTLHLIDRHAVEAVSIGRRVATMMTCTSVLVTHTRGGLVRHALVM